MSEQQQDSLAGVPYLMGSVHTFSPGYGYGARVPTVRNQPTLPASVPKYRHAPLTDRAVDMFSSTKLNTTGDRAVQRHKDQMSMQTSGEYGKFMFTNNRPESTQGTRSYSSTYSSSSRPATSSSGNSSRRQTITPSSSSSASSSSACASFTPSSGSRSGSVLQQQQSRSFRGNDSISGNDSGGGGAGSSFSSSPICSSSSSSSSSGRLFSPINTSGVLADAATISRYRKKDPLNDSFARYTKYDLLAAKSPSRDLQGSAASFAALGNTTAAEFSRSWQLGLRPYKRSNTSRGGGSANGEGGE